MTIARRKQICLDVTSVYHCISRCVRRSFLCGYDKLSKKNYDHRRAWIEDRLLLLAEVFCIEIAGYAILSNHYHVVLNVNTDLAESLTDDEVITRWLTLYRGSELAQRYVAGESLNSQELIALGQSVARWRENLRCISRFMGNLNEYIARKANKEDDCKGAFWESRFKLQAVLDLPALLQTVCYVDLNPVRAKMATTPEESKYTSVHRRLRRRNTGLMKFATRLGNQPSTQLSTELTSLRTLPISLKQYLELLDWSGRQFKHAKRGSIDQNAPPIMTRLGVTPEQWIKTLTPQVSWKQKALGNTERIRDYCNAIGQQWIWQVH